MNYPNMKLSAALSAPWAVAIGTVYSLRAYIPCGLMPFMGFGIAVLGNIPVVCLLLRPDNHNLGGDSANRQPSPTADGIAHDECQPLVPAPLPQRRPWALPSRRCLTVSAVALVCGLGMTRHYVETATFIPVTRFAWLALVALVFVSLTTCVAFILGFACLVGDCDLEESHGPEADSSR